MGSYDRSDRNDPQLSYFYTISTLITDENHILDRIKI
ncbi:Uncharacterised protein [uncultured Bacteroides sp.]|nr:Uncharacterised protein [uncultured Bacteroides sp.]